MSVKSVPLSLKPTIFQQMRPLDIKNDLIKVANLIELCFADTLDQDGRRYISQLRLAAKNPSLTGFPGYLGQSVAGFVWEEEGNIVGNISLIPILALNKQAYLIANVAVHPDFRLRGIAKALTNTSLDQIKKRKIKSVWLQVNSENPIAHQLYSSLGFMERSRRTTWHSQINFPPVIAKDQGIKIFTPKRKDWAKQKKWLYTAYPSMVTWHLSINIKQLGPGLMTSMTRFINEKKIKQWAAYQDGRLIGTLSWQSSKGMADWLWLATAPENIDRVIKNLIPHARRSLKNNRLLTINYEAGYAIEAFKEAGFKKHRTLTWMYLQLP